MWHFAPRFAARRSCAVLLCVFAVAVATPCATVQRGRHSTGGTQVCSAEPGAIVAVPRPAWGENEDGLECDEQRGAKAAGSALRLRGGAFWFSAVAGLPEKEAFFRQISSSPPQWIRERLQKLCPFGAKEASTAAKELAAAQSGRLRGGGLRQSLPGRADAASGDAWQDGKFAQPGDLVCVTGASGFLAGHVIKQLLAQGFRVRGTVRSLNDTAKVEHLHAQFPGIELREAELVDDGVFEDIFRGCKFVIHTASPFTCPPRPGRWRTRDPPRGRRLRPPPPSAQVQGREQPDGPGRPCGAGDAERAALGAARGRGPAGGADVLHSRDSSVPSAG